MTRHYGHIFPQQSDDELFWKLDRPSEIYHENSKVTRADRTAMQHAKHDPIRRAYAHNAHLSLEAYYDLIQFGAKRYPQAPHLALPTVSQGLQRDLGEVIRQRQSQRHYSGQAMPLLPLATLLYFAYGVTRYAAPEDQRHPRRPVPSGGGIYPLEVYVLALHVESLESGAYHYDAYTHALEQLTAQNLREDLARTLLYDELAEGSAVAIILSGVFERPRFKYDELSYRLILLEAGHVGQNLCLTAEALGLGLCPVAGFVEDGVNTLLGLNGIDESALYLFAIGETPAIESRPTVGDDPEVNRW